MMNFSRLDRTIKILVPQNSLNSVGERIQEFDELIDVWAQKIDQSGNERHLNGLEIAARTHIYKIRWQQFSIELRLCRIKDKDEIYQIEFVKELGRREGLELTCKKL